MRGESSRPAASEETSVGELGTLSDAETRQVIGWYEEARQAVREAMEAGEDADMDDLLKANERLMLLWIFCGDVIRQHELDCQEDERASETAV